ncbi:MAG: hypothetical protein JXB10_00950 [Pirellulales bacterium]|nr:hypothetical protein [Pirellulales bacterium]
MPEIPCPQLRPRREYTLFQELADNIPYLLMTGLGAGILLAGGGGSGWGFAAAALYVFYALAGAVWIMVFVCPYCQFHGTRSCPCGYGRLAARLRAKNPENRFARQFRRHIPVIVPLWFIPPAAGGVFLVRDFSLKIIGLLVLFVIDAFVILPLVSRKYGCAECPQKRECPWMKEPSE